MLRQSIDKSAVLIEALPYLQSFRGETFLIKMGGSAMENPELVRKTMRDVVFLEVAGINPVVVHGGGKPITAAMQEAGLETRFVGGLRVTSPEAISIVEKTLGGLINPGLVAMINEHGGKATGIPGTDVFFAERISGSGENGEPVDIGRVGKVKECHVEDILYAIHSEVVPVISPLGREYESGKTLNVNADLAAAALACALKPAKLVYISDVPGLLRDATDPDSLIQSIDAGQAEGLLADGTVNGGMIPKIKSAVESLHAGVRKVHFVDGRLPHSLLLEIFTEQGVGTEIVR